METAGQCKRVGPMRSQPHKCPGNEFFSTAFAVYLTTSIFLKSGQFSKQANISPSVRIKGNGKTGN